MKKYLFLIAASAVALSACSKNEVVDNPSQAGAIGFGAYTNLSTKAGSSLVSSNAFPENGEMGVFAYYVNNGKWAATATPNFMFDQKVTKTAADAYTYTPIKYWPNNDEDNITFFAYYPYGATGLSWVDHAGTPAKYENTSANLPVAQFTVAAKAADQVDFMYAPAVKDQTKSSKNGGVEGTVKFTFKHALTQVNLKAKLATALANDVNAGTGKNNTTVTVTAIKFKNIYKSGAMDMAADTPAWSGQTDSSDFEVELSSGSGVEVNSTTAIAITADTETFLMMPQTLQSGATPASIEVTYNVKTLDAALPGGFSEITNTTTAAITGAWGANNRITYTISIDLNQVKVDTDVTEWAAETTGTMA